MQPFSIKELDLQHGGQRTAPGPIDKIEHKLLLPSTSNAFYHDDSDVSLSVRNRSGEATIMVDPYYGFTVTRVLHSLRMSITISSYSLCFQFSQGKLCVPRHVKRELHACLTAGHIVYRLHHNKDKNRVQLEFCLSQDAFAVDVKGTHHVSGCV